MIENLLYSIILISLGFLFALLVSKDQLSKRHTDLALVWTLISFLVLSFFVVSFFVFFPEWTVRADSNRYLQEISMIAKNPFLWDPWRGEGPGYKATAKMGYSYFVGFFSWAAGSSPLFSALFFNLVMATLTGFLVFVFSIRLTGNAMISILALIGSTFYPEVLFWTGRVLRETTAFFLVMVIFLGVINMFDSHSKKGALAWLAVMSVAALGIVLVRAQLVMLLPLAIGVWFSIYVFSGRIRLCHLSVSTFLLVLMMIYLWPIFRQQIVRAVGSGFLDRMADPGYWVENISHALHNVPHILTIVAREDFGNFGFLLAPFFLTFGALVVLGVIWLFGNKKSMFRVHGTAIIALSVLYVAALAVNGSVNIRFRSVVVPILMVLAAHSFWRLALSLGFSKLIRDLITFRWLTPEVSHKGKGEVNT